MSSSYTNLDAPTVIAMAQKKIEICRKKTSDEWKSYITSKYYRKYVVWNNFINLLRWIFRIKAKTVLDSQTFCDEFDESDLPFGECMYCVFIKTRYELVIERLEKILSLGEAALSNNQMIKMNADDCILLGYGQNLIPVPEEELKRTQAIQELEQVVNG